MLKSIVEIFTQNNLFQGDTYYVLLYKKIIRQLQN